MSKSAKDTIDSFFSSYRVKYYTRKQILIYGGDEPPGIFYLVEGSVRVYDITRQGDEVVVNVYRPGALFPVNWVVNRKSNGYYYEAGSDVSIRMAPTRDAEKFIQNNPHVAYYLLSEALMGLSSAQERIKYLMKGSARSLAILQLIIECRRFGKIQPDGCFVEIPEGELAARAGISRETMSREMHRLKNNGILKINYKSVVVKDLNYLEEELKRSI